MMKKMLAYVLTLCVALALSACGALPGGSGSSTQESGSASSAGSVQIQQPQDEPEPERTFRIDTKEETVWYEGYSSEQTRSFRYEYDEAGHLIRIVPTEGENASAKCYDYDEAGHLIREYDSDEIFITEYTYDDQGRQASTTEMYDGSVLSVETYYYDNQGQKMMADEEGIFQGEPGDYTATTLFSYDDNGRLVQEERTAISQLVDEYKSQELSRTEYCYQTDGKLTERRTYSGEKLTSKTTYTYDQEKLSIQSTEYEPSRETEVLNFEYDDYGNLTREITIRLNDKGAQMSRVTCEYTYTEVTA